MSVFICACLCVCVYAPLLVKQQCAKSLSALKNTSEVMHYEHSEYVVEKKPCLILPVALLADKYHISLY